MQVGVPLPHQVVKPPTRRKRRKWPWTLLSIVVVTFGIVYLLYLEGIIDKKSPNKNNNDTSAPSTTPAPFLMTSSSNEPSLATTTTTSPAPQTTITTTLPPLWLHPTHPNGQPLSYTGWCSRAIPCLECQGQCFTNEDCYGDLQCFVRMGNAHIPGCVGSGIIGVSYCYRPRLMYLGDCSQNFACGQCQGTYTWCKSGVHTHKKKKRLTFTTFQVIAIETRIVNRVSCVLNGTNWNLFQVVLEKELLGKIIVFFQRPCLPKNPRQDLHYGRRLQNPS